MLLPPSLEDLIVENHPVKVINQVIDQINIDPLLKKNKGGGTYRFHPRMMLKVLVYAYINNDYSPNNENYQKIANPFKSKRPTQNFF